MNNLSSVFKTHKKMGMTEEEKKKVWDAISTHTFDVPSSSSLHVRNASSSRLYYRGLLPNLSLGATLSTTRGYALGLLVGSLVLSGGLSAFAQDSLPGDLLYPVKINVNEKLQAIIARTPEEKAQTQATLATRRLEEAEQLAIAGRLDQNIEKESSDAFISHVRKFETHLMELQNRADFKALAKVGVFFQTRIAVHAAVLKDMEINAMITSSGTSLPNTKKESHVVTSGLENSILVAVIPTVIATQHALTKIASSSSSIAPNNQSNSGQHNASLDIDPKEAEAYLIKLHENVGTPAPIMKRAKAPLTPIFVPGIVP